MRHLNIKSIASTLALISAAFAATKAARQASSPSSQGPDYWTFSLASWQGNGCPDFPTYTGNDTGYMTTRQSVGPYMFNSSTDTWWFYLAYPWMRYYLPPANRGGRQSITWCEAVVKYQELKDSAGTPIKNGTSKWRLRLHKNTTTMEANYYLDTNVTAGWQVQYGLGDQEAGTYLSSDFTEIQGPYNSPSNDSMELRWLEPDLGRGQIKMPGCGSGTFRIDTTLLITTYYAAVGGAVDSKEIDWNDGRGPLRYGANQGFSYDWEPCV